MQYFKKTDFQKFNLQTLKNTVQLMTFQGVQFRRPSRSKLRTTTMEIKKKIFPDTNTEVKKVMQGGLSLKRIQTEHSFDRLVGQVESEMISILR